MRGLSCGTNTPRREPFQTSFPFILALRSYFKIDSFSTNTQISNLIKLRPVGAEMFHTDGHNNRPFAVLPARLKNKPVSDNAVTTAHGVRTFTCLSPE